MGKNQLTSPESIAMLERMRTAVSSLPEVDEEVDGFGHTSLRVRGKPFVIMGQSSSGPSLSVKSDRDTQDFLIRHRPFTKTRYIGQHGWVSAAEIPPADWNEIEGLVIDGYLLVAPARLAAEVRAGFEPADGS